MQLGSDIVLKHIFFVPVLQFFSNVLAAKIAKFLQLF